MPLDEQHFSEEFCQRRAVRSESFDRGDAVLEKYKYLYDGELLNSVETYLDHSSSPQLSLRQTLLSLHCFSAFPLDWGYLGEVLMCSNWKSFAKLWNSQQSNRSESIWQTLSCKMRLQLSNNLLMISGNKIVCTVELKEVCRDALAGSCLYFMAHQRFFLLCWFVTITDTASWDDLWNLLVHSWPIESFLSPPQTALDTQVACMYCASDRMSQDIISWTTILSPLNTMTFWNDSSSLKLKR